jgi:hypothetical protein
MNKELLKHLADGGDISDANGSRFKATSDTKAFLNRLLESDWQIAPEYEDGIYLAKCLTSGNEVTLMKGEEWEEIDLGGSFRVNITQFTNITRIGDLPKEPTIADKIAAVPNDFVPDWGDRNQVKWSVRYHHYHKRWQTMSYDTLETPGTTYFRTEGEAQRVIDEVLS